MALPSKRDILLGAFPLAAEARLPLRAEEQVRHLQNLPEVRVLHSLNKLGVGMGGHNLRRPLER